MPGSPGWETLWDLDGTARPRGFDQFSILPGQGLYHDPFFIDPDDEWPTVPADSVGTPRRGGPDSLYPTGTRHPGHVTDLIAEKTIAWLERRDRSKPFLLFCHHKAPHGEFEYAARYEHIFDHVEIPEPDSLWEDKSHRSDGSRAGIESVVWSARQPGGETNQE